MTRPRMRGPAAPLLALFLGLPATAREIVLAPDPAGRPVLAPAIQAADDGDTLVLANGVYRETVTIAKPIEVRGLPGAVLDPSEPLSADWAPAPEIGRGVYRFPAGRKPQALILDDRIVAEIDRRRAEGGGPWSWKTLLASGPPLGQWEHLRALWMYSASDKTAYVHLAGDADPRTRAWRVLWTAEPVVAFRGAAGAGLRSVTVSRGFIGVALLGRSSRCTVSDCTIGPWERTGVLIGEGAAACRIEKNRIARGAFETWSPVGGSKALYEIWKIHKNVGYYDRIGVSIFRAGADNRVLENHIVETFDGIALGDYSVESLDIPLAHPEDGKGTEIAGNVIERTRDSGLELGAGCIDVRVHHNTLRQTHGGLRFKLPRIGPVFIYRNVLEGGEPFNLWFSMDDSPAEGYVYHNTVIGGDAAVIYSSFNKSHGIGAPKWHFYNNLFAGKGFFRNWRVDAPVNFTADYNVVSGGNRPWPDDPSREPHSIYVPDAGPLATDHRPLPGSPAVDAGWDLSSAFPKRPLPGCEPGGFKGKAPDAGALEGN